MPKPHTYSLTMTWTGNHGEGTKSYRGYSRDHVYSAEGKPDLVGSSDPAFRGDPSRYNPEELLVASVSSCHMLWYLHLCASNGIVVTGYRDQPLGTMEEQESGAGAFSRIVLRPLARLASGSDVERARQLHEDAHRYCFIANSVRFPIEVEPSFETEA